MARRHLQDRRALVTGASGGLGREIARELARRGAHVVLFARRRERIDELARELQATGVQSVAVPGDVTNAEDRAAALSAARDEFGGLDVLVNNAGISAHGRFLDSSPERLRKIMEANFFAAAELAREAGPLLAAGRQSVVVNIGSILGHRGIPHTSEYCASKFALHGWSESVRPEFALRGIDVLVVSPAATKTELFDNLIERRGDRPWKEKRGDDAQLIARRTVAAIERGSKEVIPSWRGWAMVKASRWFPRLMDRVLHRYG